MAIENTDTQTDEFEQLKQEADLLGITYSPNIGFDTLRQRVNEKKLTDNPTLPELTREEKIRRAAYAEAHRLVRCVITCHNPAKQQTKDEHIIVSGEYFGTIKRQVPYGSKTSEGWHIENAIYKHLRDKKYQVIETGNNPNTGRPYQKSYETNEYTIIVLPPLTDEQMDTLKSQQAARSNGLTE